MDLKIDNLVKDIISIDENDSLNNARDLMLKNNISRIVAVRKSEPVGITTEKRIASFLYNNIGRSLDEIKILEVMKYPLISVKQNSSSLQECAKLMLDKNISSLLVTYNNNNNTHNKGIITKSDLVRKYSEECQGINSISNFMTRNVYTVLQSHSLHTAISIMKRNHVSRVIVSRNNEPIGIITSRDIMPITAFVEGEQKTEPADLEGISHIVLARDIMKKPPITLNENEDLAKAASIMTKSRISGIPIVNVQQQLVGIITKTDIVRAICDLKKSTM